MPTFRYNKLVRDNIPGWHTADGHTVVLRALTGTDLSNALIDKLREEAQEVEAAQDKDELLEEIADVQQIIDSLCTVNGFSPEDLRRVLDRKAEKKGAFLKGYFIDTVTMPEGDKWVEYCRLDPDKYPEI